MSIVGKRKTERMTYLAILTAIVIVLQCFVTFVRFPFLPTSFNLALIPIAIGAILLGPRAGAWLGFICGAVVLIMGVTGADIFTYTLFTVRPLMTVVICLVKTTVAGLVAGVVYRLLARRTHWGAMLTTAAAVPVVNTALFILGALTIWQGIIETGRRIVIDSAGTTLYTEGMSAFAFILVVLVTINFFLFELVPCLALSPAVERIIAAVKKNGGTARK